jgi:predicted aminopeptidase
LRYRDEVIALIEATRTQLTALYANTDDDASKRERKLQTFAEARAAHGEIASRHEVTKGFTRWFADDLNNAKIGSIAAYNSETAAFINMIQAHQFNFEAFFSYVENLGALEKPARDRCLAVWKQQSSLTSGDCPEIELASATASG